MRRKGSVVLILASACLMAGCSTREKSPDKSNSAGRTAASRRAQLVEANIIAVQAYQMVLARTAGDTPSACYPATPDTATLQVLVKHQESLLSEPTASVVKWADSEPSQFNPAKDLEPLLDAGYRCHPNSR